VNKVHAPNGDLSIGAATSRQSIPTQFVVPITTPLDSPPVVLIERAGRDIAGRTGSRIERSAHQRELGGSNRPCPALPRKGEVQVDPKFLNQREILGPQQNRRRLESQTPTSSNGETPRAGESIKKNWSPRKGFVTSGAESRAAAPPDRSEAGGEEPHQGVGAGANSP
jgi:hypothetical protein